MMAHKINDRVTYALIALMWAPHATKECIVGVCNGPVFVSPAWLGFMTPFVTMDMSFHGFLMQLLWAPLFVVVMWGLFHLRDNKRFGTYFAVYFIRWVIFFVCLIIIYNLLFWGGLRPFIFPSFIF